MVGHAIGKLRSYLHPRVSLFLVPSLPEPGAVVIVPPQVICGGVLPTCQTKANRPKATPPQRKSQPSFHLSPQRVMPEASRRLLWPSTVACFPSSRIAAWSWRHCPNPNTCLYLSVKLWVFDFHTIRFPLLVLCPGLPPHGIHELVGQLDPCTLQIPIRK